MFEVLMLYSNPATAKSLKYHALVAKSMIRRITQNSDRQKNFTKSVELVDPLMFVEKI